MKSVEGIKGLAISYDQWEPSDFDFQVPQEKTALSEYFTARSRASALDQMEIGMLYSLLSDKFGLDWEDVQKLLVCNNGLSMEEMREE